MTGVPYYNGPNDAGSLRQYLNELVTHINSVIAALPNSDGIVVDTLAELEAADALNVGTGFAYPVYIPQGLYNFNGFDTDRFTPFTFSPRTQLTRWDSPDFYSGFLINDTFLGQYPNGAGANIWRFVDRLFVGQAIRSAGRTQSVDGHDITFVSKSTGLASGYLERSSTCFSASPNGGVGMLGATQASDQYAWYGASVWATGQTVAVGVYRGYGQRVYVSASAGVCGVTPPTWTSGTQSDGGVDWTYVQPTWQTPIGGAFGAVSDVLDGNGAWAMYAEVVRRSGCSAARGFELVSKNLGDLQVLTPYSTVTGLETTNLHFNGGGDPTLSNGAPANASTAAAVFSGLTAGKVFEKGLVFRDGAINGVDLAAVAFARTQRVAWYNATGLGMYITSDVADPTKAVAVEASNDLLAIKVRGTTVLSIGNAQMGFFGTAPGSKPTITGSKGANAALADLLTKGAALGLWVDGTS